MSAAAALVQTLTDALSQAGDEARALQNARYLKTTTLRHLGVTVPAIRQCTKRALSEAPDLTHATLLEVLDRLWAEPVFEHRMAAVEVGIARPADLKPSDVPRIEAMLRQAGTWALVDPLASQVAADLLARHPDQDTIIARWGQDPDVWLRRSALLVHLRPLREGAGNWPRFAALADGLLEDREFFVRKAIGWILRDTARKRPALVYAWLLPRASRASGVTLREAVKHLGEADAERILTASRT